MPELARDEIEALAREVFGPKCRALAWHPIEHGADHAVVFATLVVPARVVVLKLAYATSATRISREAAIQLRDAHESTVPACEALAVADSCQRFPWRYLMMAHAPGMGWRDGLKRMSPHARYDIFRQLGEATAALHSLRYPQFGEVVELPPPPQGEGAVEALAARARWRIANP